MAQLNTDSGSDHGKKGGKKRPKKGTPGVDMTPMVDLAFLLLTFFVLTSTFSKPKSMELTFPVEKPENPKELTEVNGYTILLSKDNRVFWYEGAFKKVPKNGKPATTLTEVKFGRELRQFILDKNKEVNSSIVKLKEDFKANKIQDTTFKRLAKNAANIKSAPFFIIKTDDKAVYKNVVDALDELNICNARKNAIVDIEKGELELLNKSMENNGK